MRLSTHCYLNDCQWSWKLPSRCEVLQTSQWTGLHWSCSPVPLDLFCNCEQGLVHSDDGHLSKIQNVNCLFHYIHWVANHGYRVGLIVEERQWRSFCQRTLWYSICRLKTGMLCRPRHYLITLGVVCIDTTRLTFHLFNLFPTSNQTNDEKYFSFQTRVNCCSRSMCCRGKWLWKLLSKSSFSALSATKGNLPKWNIIHLL